MAKTRKKTFDQVLNGFVKSVKLTKKYAQECAEMALEHFEATGDLTYCEKFLTAIETTGKNFVRRKAYLVWLCAHAPVVMIDGVLKKDKSDDAVEFDIEGSYAKPFWDYMPEAETKNFFGADVIEAIKNTLNRFDTKKNLPGDKEASIRLKQAYILVQQLEESPAFVAAVTADMKDAKIEEIIEQTVAAAKDLVPEKDAKKAQAA